MVKEKGKPNPLPETAGMHWGAGMAERRVAMGMTQAALADRLNINLRTIQAWESGRRSPVYTELVEDALTRLERDRAEEREVEAMAEAEAVA